MKGFVTVIERSIFTVYTIYDYINSGRKVCLPNDFWANFVTKSMLTLSYRSACLFDFEFKEDGKISVCCKYKLFSF